MKTKINITSTNNSSTNNRNNNKNNNSIIIGIIIFLNLIPTIKRPIYISRVNV